MGNLEQAMKDECLTKIDNKEVWKCALDIEGEEKGMNLEKLYKMQEELDNYIIKNRNISMSKDELLDKTILALLVEVGELANATRCFKHWSLKGPESKERLLEELADAWHFYLSIGNQVGLKITEDDSPTEGRINWAKENIKLKQMFIVVSGMITDLYIFGVGCNRYEDAGQELWLLGKLLGFTDEEVEQAYLKKHEENYRRQREGC